jgi:hypothetical protein
MVWTARRAVRRWFLPERSPRRGDPTLTRLPSLNGCRAEASKFGWNCGAGREARPAASRLVGTCAPRNRGFRRRDADGGDRDGRAKSHLDHWRYVGGFTRMAMWLGHQIPSAGRRWRRPSRSSYPKVAWTAKNNPAVMPCINSASELDGNRVEPGRLLSTSSKGLSATTGIRAPL